MINGVGSIFNNKYMAVQGQTTTNAANTTTVPIGQEGYVSSDDSEKKTDNKLKLALMGLGVLALSAAGTAIYVKTRKKLPTASVSDLKNVSEQTIDIQKGVKKFLNSAGESVDNVKLQKGKAVLDDGSGFSGIFKTVNGKGQDIAVKYQDGFMTESTINGKLFKKIENLSDPNIMDANVINYSRAQGVSITTFNEYGIIEKEAFHLYDKNGKISRSYSKNAGEWSGAIDFKDGKIVAKTEFGRDGIFAEVFDKDGNVVKKIKPAPSSQHSVVDVLSDGSKKERIGYLKYDGVATPATQYDDKMSVKQVISYDSKGKMKESLSLLDSGASDDLQINYADGSMLSVTIPKNLKFKNSDTGTVRPAVSYFGPNDINARHATIDYSGKSKTDNIHSQKDLETLFQQVKKLEAKAKEENIDFPYERMEEYLAQMFNLQ